ncbi:MAG: type II toxin-antitoxin system RelE/ParE family toxin [Candidatus Sungbacteria bacterium]|nr:type II toxin-antitoxin system RelE/ParE family toxin [Candidatus Sungbacteria bacterium]
MYRVLLESRAERDLGLLERSMHNRIIERLLKLRVNPRDSALKLIGSKNAWRIRIGDWRVLYEIDDGIKEVKIYRIKHRSRAY